MKQLPDIEMQRVKRGDERTKELLYELLRERPRGTSISHQKMPTWLEHSRFVDSEPYRCWYLISAADAIVGAAYITMNNEIGVSVFKSHQGQAYAPAAVKWLIDNWKPWQAKLGIRLGHFVANINPQNAKSLNMFKNLGFVDHQITLVYRGE